MAEKIIKEVRRIGQYQIFADKNNRIYAIDNKGLPWRITGMKKMAPRFILRDARMNIQSGSWKGEN